MKKVCCLFLVCLFLTSCSASPATAPATVPYTFGDGQTAPATQAGTLPVTQPETEEPPADPAPIPTRPIPTWMTAPACATAPFAES